MNLQRYRPILELLITSLIAYLLHKLFFYLNSGDSRFENFHTSIEALYGFFLLCSTTIIYILIQVGIRRKENVGFSFLLLTGAKMGVAYAFLRPILNSKGENLATEKMNFLFVFIVFLAIETVVAIRILNNKQ